MKRAVIINNKLIFIDADLSESDEMFYDRINFIIKNNQIKNNQIKNNQKYDLDYLVNLSKIYSNVKYKKCIYDDKIMSLII
jgi:hypothetical protein